MDIIAVFRIWYQDQQTRILRSVLKELRTLNAGQTPVENEIPEQETSCENKRNGD